MGLFRANGVRLDFSRGPGTPDQQKADFKDFVAAVERELHKADFKLWLLTAEWKRVGEHHPSESTLFYISPTGLYFHFTIRHDDSHDIIVTLSSQPKKI